MISQRKQYKVNWTIRQGIQRLAFCLTFCFTTSLLVGQTKAEVLDLPFTIENQDLPFPGVGGLSSPQFSTIDLNFDGIKDLFVFDRIGDKVLTFINGGQTNQVDYSYEPKYEKLFPKMTDWALLRDFDGDGIEDIFTNPFFPSGAIAVYKGRMENDSLIFDRFNQKDWIFEVISVPSGQGFTNLLSSFVDIPSIDDVDGDGDLDVLTFEDGGSYLHYYKNFSVENGFGRDSMIFELESGCWGGFYESDFNEEINLADAPGECATFQNPPIAPRHAGSTVTSFDADNDNDRDLLIGDLASGNVVFLENGGDISQAWINNQDVNYPSDDFSIDLKFFPATYLLDLNNDSKRDLIATSNNISRSENNKVLYFKNNGEDLAPIFSLQQEDFLVDKMLEFGEEAHPAFFDYNADGLMDILLGTSGTYDASIGNLNGRLILFENIGTAQNPAFEMIDDDYLTFSNLFGELWAFTPSFGDLDGDGDQDLLIGNQKGKLIYLENSGGAGMPVSFGAIQNEWKFIDVGSNSKPFIYDVDKDGLLDLVIGEDGGNNGPDGRCSSLNFYKNTGSVSSPFFDPEESNFPNTQCFGEVILVDNTTTKNSSSPFIIESEGELFLFTGTETGLVLKYKIGEDLYQPFELVDSILNLDVGNQSSPYFIDLNQDDFYDIIIGNRRGGLSFYSSNISTLSTSTENEPDFLPVKIYPNPTTDILNILIDGEAKNFQLQIYNQLGQLVFKQTDFNSNEKLDVSMLVSGAYVLKLSNTSIQYVSHFFRQ